MTPYAGLPLCLALALALVATMGTLAGSAHLAVLTGVGALVAAAAWGRTTLRLAAIAGILLGTGSMLARHGGVVGLSAPREIPMGELVTWSRRVPGALTATVFGPEGHRLVRAAQAWLEALAGIRSDLTVRTRDPAVSGGLEGVARLPRTGEVALAAGGRRVLVPDAAPRSLAAGLRGLARERPGRVRFLAAHAHPRPGAPTGFERIAAAMASHLAVDVTQGRPDPAQSLWIHTPGAPDPSGLESFLEGGGALLVLGEAELPPRLAETLARRGLQGPGPWLRDASRGPRRGHDAVRVLRLQSDRPHAVLPGVRSVQVSRPARPLLLAVDAPQLDQGEQPDAGGSLVTRPGDHHAGGLSESRGFVAYVADADFLRDAGLARVSNRDLALEMVGTALDGLPALPREALVPTGGVDPDLEPGHFGVVAFLLLAGLPGLCLLAALAASLRLRAPGSAPAPA
jgi:hypothetical protein